MNSKHSVRDMMCVNTCILLINGDLALFWFFGVRFPKITHI